MLRRQRGVEVFTRTDGAILALFSDKWRLQYISKEMEHLTIEPLVADTMAGDLTGKTVEVTGAFRLINPKNWLITPVEVVVK